MKTTGGGAAVGGDMDPPGGATWVVACTPHTMAWAVGPGMEHRGEHHSSIGRVVVGGGASRGWQRGPIAWCDMGCSTGGTLLVGMRGGGRMRRHHTAARVGHHRNHMAMGMHQHQCSSMQQVPLEAAHIMGGLEEQAPPPMGAGGHHHKHMRVTHEHPLGVPMLLVVVSVVVGNMVGSMGRQGTLEGGPPMAVQPPHIVQVGTNRAPTNRGRMHDRALLGALLVGMRQGGLLRRPLHSKRMAATHMHHDLHMVRVCVLCV